MAERDSFSEDENNIPSLDFYSKNVNGVLNISHNECF